MIDYQNIVDFSILGGLGGSMIITAIIHELLRRRKK